MAARPPSSSTKPKPKSPKPPRGGRYTLTAAAEATGYSPATLAPLARSLSLGRIDDNPHRGITYSPAEVSLLRKLRAGEPLSSRDVGEAFNVAPGTITRNARQHGIGSKVGHVHSFSRDDVARLAEVVNRDGAGNPGWRTAAGAAVTDEDCLRAYREHGTYAKAGEALGLSMVNVRKRAMRAAEVEG